MATDATQLQRDRQDQISRFRFRALNNSFKPPGPYVIEVARAR